MKVKRVIKLILKGLLLSILLIVILLIFRIFTGLLLREAPDVPTPEEESLRARAIQLHRDAIVIDGHNDLPWWILDFGFDLGMDGDKPSDSGRWIHTFIRWLPWRPKGKNIHTHTDLSRMREGGLDAQFFSIWVGPEFYNRSKPIQGQARQRAIDMIGALREQVRRHSNEIEMAYTSRDIRRIVSGDKVAALMGLEGGHAIEDNLGTLQSFYELGIRYMTLTHRFSHNWADSEGDINDSDVVHHGGLSDFGRDVVREMNRLGMIVDVSHVSDETFWDVMETTSAPIMASHSSVRAIANHTRNLTDDMLREVAANNGIVMINFAIIYIDPEKTSPWKVFTGWHWFWHPRQPETPLSLVVDHIDYAVKVAGVDHVGLGSDFDGLPSLILPEDLEDVSDFPNITVELVRRGYSEEDIRKILGGNILRVFFEVEQIPAR